MVTTNCPWNTNLNTSGITNVAPIIISNWWTVSGPGTGYTNYGTGLSTGSLSPLPTSGGIGTATFYVSYSTWTNTTSSLPSYCTNTNSVQVPFNVIQISNWCVSTVPANQSRTTIGVGEQVNLFLVGSPLGTFTWTNFGTNSLGTNLSGSLALTTSPTNAFTAPSNASTANITVSYAGGSNIMTFSILEPTGIDHADLISVYTNNFPTNIPGAGMYCRVYVGPTNVSFYRVQFMEALTYATNISGYYSNTTLYPNPPVNLTDPSANKWFQINPDNSWQYNNRNDGNDYDRTYDGAPGLEPPPWSQGGYTWNYTPKWKIDAGQTNNVQTPWSAQFTIGSDGTLTVQKFGHTVTRNTNNVYTTQN